MRGNIIQRMSRGLEFENEIAAFNILAMTIELSTDRIRPGLGVPVFTGAALVPYITAAAPGDRYLKVSDQCWSEKKTKTLHNLFRLSPRGADAICLAHAPRNDRRSSPWKSPARSTCYASVTRRLQNTTSIAYG